jgi:hypothetical protein
VPVQLARQGAFRALEVLLVYSRAEPVARLLPAILQYQVRRAVEAQLVLAARPA